MWGHLAARCPRARRDRNVSPERGFDFVFSSRFGYNAEQWVAHLCGIGDMWGHLAARCPRDRNVSPEGEEK